MSDPAKTHRVLVKKGERQEGCSTITEYEYIEVTAEEAIRYCNGDPAWRSATAQSDPWPKRLWHRLTGDA